MKINELTMAELRELDNQIKNRILLLQSSCNHDSGYFVDMYFDIEWGSSSPARLCNHCYAHLDMASPQETQKAWDQFYGRL